MKILKFFIVLSFVFMGFLIPEYRFLAFIGFFIIILFNSNFDIQGFYKPDNHNAIDKFDFIKKLHFVIILIFTISSIFYIQPMNLEINFSFLWLLSILFLFRFSLLYKTKNKQNFFLEYVDIFLLSIPVILGAIIRFYLATKYYLDTDEAFWIHSGFDIVEGKIKSFMHLMQDFSSNIPSFFVAIAIKIFPGNPLLQARFFNTLQGVLCIILIYLIVNLLFKNRLISFLTAMLWAISVWKINDSTMGFVLEINSFFELLAILFFIYGFRYREKYLFVVLSGFCCAILFHLLYVSLTSILLFSFLIFIELLINYHKLDKSYFLKVFLFFFAFIIAAFPTFYRIYSNPEIINRHIAAIELQEIAKHQEMPKISSMLQKSLYLIDIGKTEFFKYFFSNRPIIYTSPLGPPVLDIISKILFLVGVSICISRFYKNRLLLFFILFFVIMFIPIVLRPQSYYRLTAASPPAYILISFGIFGLYKSLKIIIKNKKLLTAVMLLPIVISIYFNKQIYNTNYKIHMENFWNDFSKQPLTKLGKEMIGMSDSCYFYIPERMNNNLRFTTFLKSGNIIYNTFDTDNILNNNTEYSNKRKICFVLPFLDSKENSSYDETWNFLLKNYPDGINYEIQNEFYLDKTIAKIYSKAI